MTKPLEFFINKSICYFLVIVAFVTITLSVNAAEIVTFEKIKQDKSCGPRCLNTLLQIRDGQDKDCDIKCIYEIIGKEPFSLVNMKELRDAALKLGFSTVAYKLNISQLQKLQGYFILPIGKKTGTKENPLHYILVERIKNDYVIFIENESLETKAISIAEFTDLWNGYALVITSDMKIKPSEEKDVLKTIPIKNKGVGDYYEVKDFGNVDKGSTLTHDFLIPYEKRKDFQVRIVEKSCSCLESELSKDINGNTILKVGYKIDGVSWQKAHVTVEISPMKEIRRYGLVAFGKNSYTVTPKNCFILSPEGGDIEYPFEIEYFTDSQGFIKFDKMKCDNEDILIRNIKSFKVQTSMETLRFNFIFSLLFKSGKPENWAKTVTDKLDFIFNTSDGNRTISMDFFAKVGTDKFEVNPKEVFHITSKSNLSPIVTRIKVTFFDHQIQNLALKTDDKLPIKYSLKQQEESYLIDMELSEEGILNMPLGLSKENLYLINENKNIPKITIPISLFVRE